MNGLGSIELAIMAWLVLLAGAAVARARFMLVLRGNRKAYDLGRILKRVEPRQGVVTVVAMHVPGLEEALVEDVRLAGVVLPTLYDPARVAAKIVGAELELPRPDGLLFYLGRFQPNPTHRVQGLELALKLQELLVGPVTELGLVAPGFGVATGEVAALPFEVGEATQVLSLGAGVRRARALAQSAPPGEVHVDARRGYTDLGFRLEEVAADGASRLLGPAEDEPGEAAAKDAPSGEVTDPAGAPSTPPGSG